MILEGQAPPSPITLTSPYKILRDMGHGQQTAYIQSDHSSGENIACALATTIDNA